MSLATEISKRSLTALCSFCLLPMYRSVVWTEVWPSRNPICSSSPLQSWQSRAQVRRRAWGARLGMPACSAHRLTAYQTTFAVTAGRRQDLWRRFLACQPRVAVGSADNKTAGRIDIEKIRRLPQQIKSGVLKESPIAAELIPVNQHFGDPPQPVTGPPFQVVNDKRRPLQQLRSMTDLESRSERSGLKTFGTRDCG